MIIPKIREEIAQLSPDAVILDDASFDASIIGFSNDGRIVYDYYLMVDELMKDDDISEEDAIDYIDYNTLRSIPYMENASAQTDADGNVIGPGRAPIIVYSVFSGAEDYAEEEEQEEGN